MASAGRERPNLVVLRALKLGDLLVAVPALKGLRRRFPEHRILYAAPEWLRPLTDLIAPIDALLPTPGLDAPVPIPCGGVDIAANLHGNGADSRLRLRELGARQRIEHRSPDDSAGPDWQDGVHERERWARLVSAHGAPADPLDVAIERPEAPAGTAGAAIVHIGAAYASRHWPVDRFAAVARGLESDGTRVLFTGGDQDRARALAAARLADLPDSRVLAGRAGLRELAGLIGHAAVVVSVDTGAAHLASAFGTPSAVIFGPAPPEEWGPPPGPHRVLTDAGRRRGDAFADRPDPALLAVTAAEALAAARSVRR